MATDKTPSSKHGRLHEEEAARDKSVFGTPDPAKAEQERQKNLAMRNAMDRVAAQKPQAHGSLGGSADNSLSNQGMPDPIKPPENPYYEKARPATPQKSGALAPKTETLVGPMLLSDVQAALSDRYPHNDIHELEGATIEVKVPTGVILVDFKEVNKCKNTAELRAYIDALPIQ